MYIIDNPITITWVLKAEISPPAESSYDISLVTSELDGTYVNAGISNYIAPTATTAGSITFTLTVPFPGRYKLNLTTGTESSHTVLEETWLHVFLNTPSIAGRLESLSPGSILDPNIDYSPLTSSWSNIIKIQDFASDGTNILVIAEDVTTGSGVFKTDGTLVPITQLADATNDFSITGDRILEFIDYDSIAERWVVASNSGHIWYSDNIGATWTEAIYPTSYNPDNDTVGIFYYNPGLKVWFHGRDNANNLKISSDGATWTYQSDTEVIGGSHPYKLYDTTRITVAGVTYSILSQWEEYCWKDEDTGGSTGWTKTANNGVIGGAGGTWPLNNWITDGTIIVVSGLYRVAWCINPTNDTWAEYIDGTDLPWTSSDYVHFIGYFSEYDRPWIVCTYPLGSNTFEWWDSTSMQNSQNFAILTNPDFLGRKGIKYTKWNTYQARYKEKMHNGKWALIIAQWQSGAGSGAEGNDYIMMKK